MQDYIREMYLAILDDVKAMNHSLLNITDALCVLDNFDETQMAIIDCLTGRGADLDEIITLVTPTIMYGVDELDE